MCQSFGVLCYAEAAGLSGGLGCESVRSEQHEDGRVSVHHHRGRADAAGARGASAQPVGGTVPSGETHTCERQSPGFFLWLTVQ